MKIKKKETNSFETSIFGIDLFIKFIIDKYKKRKTSKKRKNTLHFTMFML